MSGGKKFSMRIENKQDEERRDKDAKRVPQHEERLDETRRRENMRLQ